MIPIFQFTLVRVRCVSAMVVLFPTHNWNWRPAESILTSDWVGELEGGCSDMVYSCKCEGRNVNAHKLRVHLFDVDALHLCKIP